MQQKNFTFKTSFFILIGFIISSISFAQKGIVAGIAKENLNNSLLVGATVKLTSVKDSLFKKITQTDDAGLFTFTRLAKGIYNITISYVGHFPKAILQISVSDSLVNLGKIILEKKPKQEADVVIIVKPTVSQKGDTIIYNASEFKTNPDATVEDLVKKMPGITIENGVIKAQGEDVKKVTIDGKDFFGDDASAALKNLPADIVDKIQVFDRLSDQAQFSGFDDGNSQKSINVVTKSGLKNGQFGRLYSGAGTKETYTTGGNVSFFKGNRRISLIGQANNINQQNFSAQDILGVTGNSMGGGGRGGMGGGAQGGGGGRGGPGGGGGGPQGGGGGGGRGGQGGGGGFFVGQQNGINGTNALGFNINDTWGKKVTVSGSYFFNNTNNSTNQFTNQQTFLNADSSLFYKENNLSSSHNYNNRVNLRFEYKIDSANTLMITPNLSFQNNKSASSLNGLTSYNPSSKISEQFNASNRKTNGFNLGNSILYRHAFKKRGRTFSVSFNTSGNNKNGETYVENKNSYYRTFGILKDSLNQLTDILTDGYTIGANISFTEPVAKDGQLQISYSPSYTTNKSDQEAYKYDYTGKKYSIFDPNLSNKFDNKYNTNNAGITFRKGNRDKMFSLGLALQHSSLSSGQVFPYSSSVYRTFFNVLPEASINRKISKKSSIRLNYRANTNAPGISQLQNVINNNNPLFISSGNPDLKQQVSQQLTTRYTFTNTARNQSFFANVFLQKNNNYISNATIIASKDSVLNSSVTLYKGSQLSKPTNLNGYWSARSFVTFGQMLKAIKTNVNINAGLGYTNTPGIVNGIASTAKSYNYNTGITLSSNVSQYIDYNLSYTANFNRVDNSIQPQLNSKYFNYSTSLQFNLLNKKGYFFQNDISNQTYKGLSDGFNQSFWLWNMGVGKKFLKDQKGEIKLSVFDLLKQNQSITRTITESGITDVQNQVLTQYFMLTFTYKLKNFGTAKPANNNFGGNREFRRNDMPGF
jgi:translation initiation factor 1 (eIF-1/SUI1)